VGPMFLSMPVSWGRESGRTLPSVAEINVWSYKHYQRADGLPYTVRSESRCALRLQYVGLVVSIEVAVAVCCCYTVFSC
jgi:hypothetical protein